MKNYAFLLYVLFVIACLMLGDYYSRQRDKIAALEAERENLVLAHNNQLRRVRNAQGQQRTVAPVAQLSAATLRELNAAHIAALERAFDIKLKRIQAVMRLSVTTSGKAGMPARDTLVMSPRDSLPQHFKKYSYSDNYFTMSAIADADSLHVTHYSVRNDITAIAHKGRRSPRWKFWKPRPIQCQVFLFNPHTGLDTLNVTIANGK
ncbi:hypothetical protein SAMN05421780_1198 [Flexibacter flexilis DSM 6793]|uniref:Uncharacterized protein n=1 Tax=Flexibacter flexilis DSM 6793 TaxID=927664 RepID=A0A1I1NSP8_9BACT|nr:DUF6549 family protein [Flexibacter flexilis]SFD00639.1 hypothetical protein SAMN05421780_1198 [Flexibacter flexilis DSM 6793]